MKVGVLTPGITATSFLREGIDLYSSRIAHYTSFFYEELKLSGSKRGKSAEQAMTAEKEALLKQLTPTDIVVLLDERGKQKTSPAFASWLQEQLNYSSGRVIFILGAAWGFHEELYQRQNHLLALSKMVLPHELARVVFLEQLYRAFTINRGEQYHH